VRTQTVGGTPRVPFLDLPAQHHSIKEEIMAAVEGVLAHGNFIQGKELADFEEEFAAYCGTRFAIGVANGTDALVLALKAVGVGPGDEVITAPNSFLASASAVMMAGAKPTFVDVGDDYNLDASIMEQAITRRTKVILPVHLTGRPADMRAILDIARRRGLAVIEDAAQAVGSIYRGQKVGSFGAAGCFSFHPLKNLNACGDGGMITTDDEAIYRFAMKARNHGLRSRDEWGFCSLNSRLDTLQAAILSVKLRHLEDWAQARRRNAAAYSRVLDGLVQVPVEGPDERAVYQTYVVQCERRDELQRHLSERGVETKVHYPIPIHLQDATRALGYREGDFPRAEAQAKRIMSLPVHPWLSSVQLEHVIACIWSFYGAD